MRQSVVRGAPRGLTTVGAVAVVLLAALASVSCSDVSTERVALADGAYVGPQLTPTADDAPTQLVAVEPQRRVLDTRAGAGPVTNGLPVTVDLASLVSEGTAAVAFNLTATGQTGSGYAEVAPADAPTASSTLNWGSPPGTIANGHIAKLSDDGRLEVRVVATGSAHLVMDITGCFVSPTRPGASVFVGGDRRIYDSRLAEGPLPPGASRRISVNNGVPAPVAPSAAAVNVTITDTTGSGYLTVAGAPAGATSTINWSSARQTVANAVIAAVAPDGTVTVTNNSVSGTANVVVDLTGTFAPTAAGAVGAQFYPMDPVRSHDSRTADGPLLTGQSRIIGMPVPVDATAVATNTTITGTSGRGFLSVTRPVFSAPTTSTANWYASPTTRANGSIVATEGDSARAYAGGDGSTQIVQDVAGYFR